MKNFLVKTFLFSLLFTVVISLWALHYGKFFAAPKISNSYSLNEKLQTFRHRKSDYVAVGSSITLNNLNSAELVKGLHTQSYFNLAAWGLKTSEVYKLVKAYCNSYTPKAIIISNSLFDYYSNEGKDILYNSDELTNYMKGSTIDLWYYLKHLDINYYYAYSNSNTVAKTNNHIFLSQDYDAYGGVPLANKDFEFVADKWNKKYDEIPDEKNYVALDSLCNFLASRKINLIIINCPMKKGAISGARAEAIYANHRARVKKALDKYHFYFYNADTFTINDSLYVDGLHLKEAGAKQFTDTCLKRILIPVLGAAH